MSSSEEEEMGMEGEGEEGEGEERENKKEMAETCSEGMDLESSKSKKKEKNELTPGVVYLSRIPPFMRPRKVRHLLSQFGSIGRIYLQPEDPVIHKRRQKFKKNRRRNYTEGWVEFMDKRVAKATAMALNNTQIGGKKRYYYHDDIWNMKYLSKFRWSHLTEKIAYEQAVEEQQLRLEMAQLKRENDQYMKNYERSKQVSAIVDRKMKRGEELKQHEMRRFKQKRVAPTPLAPPTALLDSAPQLSSALPPSTSSRVKDDLLRMIFPDKD